MSKISAIVGICSALAVSAGANAGVTIFQMDVNQAFASVGGPFGGTSHTGSINISQDANTELSGLFLFENPQAVGGAVATVNGRIDTALGAVTGAFFDVILTSGAGFHCLITPGSGSISPQAGQGFQVDSLTFNVTFTNLEGGVNFGGVNVAQFGPGPFTGAFLMHEFNPTPNNHTDADVSLEFYVFIPTPGSLALLGVAGMAMGHRRRR